VQPVAPVLACSDAAPQLVHAVEPADAEYVPAAQLTQVVGPDCPDSVEYFPAKHPMQALAPASLWYIPAAHAEHTVAEAAKYWPAAHVPVDADRPEVAQ
jgi:hypothetical protein